MTVQLTVVISVAAAIIGAALGIIGASRVARRDASEEGKNNGVVLTQLGYITSGIDDIKRKQEQQDAKHLELLARMVAVEASAKQAHKRLDSLVGKPYPGNQ